MFKLKVKTDTAAFAGQRDVELARILREIADKIEVGTSQGRIFDANRVAVGSFGESAT